MKNIFLKAVVLSVVLCLGTMDSFGQETLTKPPKSPSNTINGHEYVDLGLSVKWATCNVGASSPTDYGNYYAWGETRTKSNYTEENCTTYNKNMGDIAGDSRYDAARANWGGTWRLPTKAEIDELMTNCKWIGTAQGGHYGCKITGPNGNSIFLPCAGWRFGTLLYGAGEGGSCWSSSPCESDTMDAYFLGFSFDGGFMRDGCPYDCGKSVRAVSE